MSRKDIVNYKPSIREVNSVDAPVRIKRITVAAVLDGTYDHGVFKPLDEARLNAIKGLVAAAVGADLERGDSVDIQSSALSQPYVAPIPNPIDTLRSFIADPIHLYETAGVVLLLFIAMVWMLKRSLSRRSARKRAIAEAEGRGGKRGRNAGSGRSSGSRAQRARVRLRRNSQARQ